jgi:hypothetical protein
MPAVGALVRCTDGTWMTRPPQSCPGGHLLRPGAMLVGHQPCSTCRGGHTTWTCLDCGGVVYGPPLRIDCRVLAGPPRCDMRSSSSPSATAIDGSGPPRSRAARRNAATNCNSASMVSMSRTRGGYGRTNSRRTSPSALTTYAVEFCWTALCQVTGVPVAWNMTRRPISTAWSANRS